MKGAAGNVGSLRHLPQPTNPAHSKGEGEGGALRAKVGESNAGSSYPAPLTTNAPCAL